MKKVIILSGANGSGNTTIIKELIDLNYLILSSFESNHYYDLLYSILKDTTNPKIAIFLNVKQEEQYIKRYNAIKKIKKEFIDSLFIQITITAREEILINRFQETRNTHPYFKLNNNVGIKEAIEEEFRIIEEFKSDSDYILDTSSLLPKEAAKILKSYIGESEEFVINFVSFGFKYGTYTNADFLFDVRFLPNPFYIEDLKPKSGKDQIVSDYVFSFSEANELYEYIVKIINLSISGFKEVNKNTITVGIACTGGQHRSVAFVEKLSKDERIKNKKNVIHIEGDRGNWNG